MWGFPLDELGWCIGIRNDVFLHKGEFEMKATIKLLTVTGFAGLSLAACGTSNTAAVSSTSTTAVSSKSNSTSAGSTTTLPANAAVGFNGAKTEFVLPHHVGLLPASELALAKSDSAYATGLANPGNWMKLSSAQPGGGHSSSLWYYAGPTMSTAHSTSALDAVSNNASVKQMAIGLEQIFKSNDNQGGLKVSDKSPSSVNALSLNLLVGAGGSIAIHPLTSSYQLIAPSNIEIQAAPVGTLAIGSTTGTAFCTPTPQAYLDNGKLTEVSGLPSMTAGPSVIFATPFGAPGAASNNGFSFYDKGTTSCGAFR